MQSYTFFLSDAKLFPATRQITVQDNASYHAIFKRNFMQYKLQLSVNKPVLGTLDPEPDEYLITAGDDMTVYVEPDSLNDARFVGWSDGSTDNPRVFAPTHHTRVQAIFDTDLEVSISLEAQGPGTVQGDGIYKIGDTVTIKAIPFQNCTFDRWSDGDTRATRTITATEDLSLSATFTY